MNRIIAHLDMDAFFASVEERDKPWLEGKPIVVGSDPMAGKGRGVVSTANYKAREYGIRSALPISKAWQFSEEAKKKGLPVAEFLGCDIQKYSKVSEEIMEIVSKFANDIEVVSIDESFLDLSDCETFEKAKIIAENLKKEILKKEKLTCSIGIGPNKLIAKIASDINKPNGLTIILPEEIDSFLEPLTIRKIPGIGPKTEELLQKKNIFKIGDIKKFSKSDLNEWLGKWGNELYEKVRGKDDSEFLHGIEAKSVGEQETFLVDTFDFSEILEKVGSLSEGVIRSVKNSGFSGFKTAVLTVRFSGFETKSKSVTFSELIFEEKDFKFKMMNILLEFLSKEKDFKNGKKAVRLLGIRAEKLIK